MARSVRIYRSHPTGLAVGNFGDEITIPILNRVFSIEAVPVPMHKAELIGAGSILDSYYRSKWTRRALTRALCRQDILHVWGSGFMFENSSPIWPQRLAIHSVRGHLSASRLPNFIGSVGDPAILAPLLVNERRSKDQSILLIPHMHDYVKTSELTLPHKGWKVINLDGDVLDITRQISKAGMIVSSSLHGLIVADAFGIPAVWATTVIPLRGNSLYKFYDHQSARGATFNDPISYVEAISMKDAYLADLATVAARDLEEWRRSIMGAFPFS